MDGASPDMAECEQISDTIGGLVDSLNNPDPAIREFVPANWLVGMIQRLNVVVWNFRVVSEDREMAAHNHEFITMFRESLSDVWSSMCVILAAVHDRRLESPGLLESAAVAEARGHNFFDSLVEFTGLHEANVFKFLIREYNTDERTQILFRCSMATIAMNTDLLPKNPRVVVFNWAYRYFTGPLGAFFQCFAARNRANSPFHKLPKELVIELVKTLYNEFN